MNNVKNCRDWETKTIEGEGNVKDVGDMWIPQKGVSWTLL